ncbi:hypothetical protein EV401DRAFT_2193676 [Pisolithus croceorrhizus]|nr:hypothetical protein EV401DRAFT_2193676 [Pisolithus croceorrhizus]
MPVHVSELQSSSRMSRGRTMIVTLQTIGYIYEFITLLTSAPEIKRDIDCRVRYDNPSSDVQGERDHIMQIDCEATQSPSVAVYKLEPSGVVKIMTLHYDKMTFYVEQALFWL